MRAISWIMAQRGIGAVASAVSSLIIGWVIAKFGTTWMLVLLLAARLGSMIALAGFPEIQQSRSAVSADHRSLSIGAFLDSIAGTVCRYLELLFWVCIMQ